MRRIALRVSVALLFLTACAPRSLPPQEVMRNVTEASRALQSASFVAVGYFTGSGRAGTKMDFSLTHGVLKDGGKQVQFTLTLKDEDSAGEGTLLEMAMLYPCDLYLKPISLSSGATLLGIPYGQLESMKGEWWRMDCKGGSAVMPTLPDPTFTSRQSDVLMVKQVREREEIHGRLAYHYDIRLDADKLGTYLGSFSSDSGGAEGRVFSLLNEDSLQGELWVDAETFHLHRLVWTMHGREGGEPLGRFDLQLQDHNGVLSSSLPARARLLTGVTLTDSELPSLIPAILPVR